MAGIQNAIKLVKDKEGQGRVLAKGNLFKDENQTKYLIIEILINGEPSHLTTQYSYNSDLSFDGSINLGDIVELKILDGYTAKWSVIKND